MTAIDDIAIREYINGIPDESIFDRVYVPTPNAVSIGVQHNEQTGHSNYCDFTLQERGTLYLCHCNDIRDQLPGWAYPDCPKMLPQYDVGDVDTIFHTVLDMVIRCEDCGELIPYIEAFNICGTVVCSECIEDYIRCEYCGNYVPSNEIDSTCSHTLCYDCARSYVGTCDGCRAIIMEEDEYFNDGDYMYCNSCMDDCTFVCDWCGERYRNDYANSDDNITICDNCYENAGRCDRCNCIININDGNLTRDDQLLCDYCYDDECDEHPCNDAVMHYGYRPVPHMYGNSLPYFGIEIEIDTGDAGHDEYNSTVDAISQYDELYMTEDGSLSDWGIEFKTHPMDIDYAMQFDWEKLCNDILSNGYRSHDTGHCGLHIHISRKAFVPQELHGAPLSAQEVASRHAAARLIMLHDRFWDQLMKFSRRTEYSLDSWAKRYILNNTDTEDDILNEITEKYHGVRHLCVNTRGFISLDNPHSTYEWRMPNGSLNPKTIRATVQMAYYLWYVTMTKTLSEIHSMSWDDFKAEIPARFTELKEYMGRRGI